MRRIRAYPGKAPEGDRAPVPPVAAPPPFSTLSGIYFLPRPRDFSGTSGSFPVKGFNRLVAMGSACGKNGSFSPTLCLFSVT